MQISWRQYLKLKLAKRNAIFSLGISFGKHTHHVVGLVKQGSQIFWAHACTFDKITFKKEFSDWVKANALAGTPTYISFTESYYQLLQVDRPDVADHEIHAALHWPLKELLTTDKPVAYDFFDLPVQVSGQHKINTISVEYEQVENLNQLMFDLQLDLKQIVVEELATVELVHSHSEAVLTLVQETSGEVCLNIIKDNQLYLTRRLRGFDNLGQFSKDELRMGIIESLCIQIQRSLDYFSNQLRQAPIKHIFLRLPIDHQQVVAEDIEKVIDMPVSLLTPGLEITVDVNIDEFSLNALGAAMIALHKVEQKPVVEAA